MARGFVSGAVVGVVVVGLGLAILSVATHAPKRAEAPAPQSSDAAPNPEIQPGTVDAAPGMTGDSPVTAETAPAQMQDQAGPENPPASADARAAMPEATQEAAAPGMPAGDAAASSPAPLAEADEPAAPATAPAMPAGETTPATEPGPGLPASDDTAVQSEAPVPGAAPDVAGAETPAPAKSGTPPALEAGQSPEALPAAEAPPEQALAPAPSPAPAPSRAIGTPVVPLTERAPASSLPTVGTGSQAAENAGETAEAGVSSKESEENADPRALVRNAAAFDNPEGLPVMSVLLIDAPEDREALGDLAALPFRATFVVPADAPDAAEAIAFYRGAGAEVALLLPLAPKSRPEDVEVTLEAYSDLLDQVVAVLVPAESGFQTMGPAATQLGAALAARGLGLVSLPRGLNTGHKSAAKAGAPAGLVFRELDNDGQSGNVIRRFVDNAAFKARQDEGVILLAHVRPETIQALVEWSLGNRAKQVSLAPLSYLLSHQS